MAKLIMLRHGQSLWNALNKFTGWVDVPLSERGRAEATIASCKLRDAGYRVDVCFTSILIRAIETAIVVLTECDEIRSGKIPIIQHAIEDPNWHGWDKYHSDPAQEIQIFPTPALSERYYGELQGLNKAETAEKYGKDQVQLWRRSFSVQPPGGESLEDTSHRAIPFFQERILKHLKQGENVLVAAHGNSLRSIMMDLDNLDQDEVVKLELETGVPIVYDVSPEGKVTNKIILNS